MSDREPPAIPSVLMEMMENPMPDDSEGPLYKEFAREIIADMQPKTSLDKIRVIRWAQRDGMSWTLRRYRRMLLERAHASGP
jgi:hypothetical protein